MSYSISPILHTHKDKNGLQKVQIRIIYNRQKVYLKTDFRLKADTWQDSVKINSIIRKQVKEAEDKLLDAIREGLTESDFKTLFKKEAARKIYLTDYIEMLAKKVNGKLSEGSIRHIRSLSNKIPETVTLSQIHVSWLESFEKKLRDQGLDGNTINSNMKRLKSILSKASAEGFIDERNFKRYKTPPYRQKLVEYLTEKEISALTKVIKAANLKSYKVAGYYFLLSCYTGWRISDAKRFDSAMIQGDSLILRAKKNGQIVSFPIHSRLRAVLKFVTKNAFDLSETNTRIYIKELCGLAGIKKDVKYHASRHSFAMMLMTNGLTIDEVAEKLGDSPLIAKVYARVHNESLDKKIRERLR
jgi:site-specific recombinase XerD